MNEGAKKRIKFSEEQVMKILRQADRNPIGEVAKKHRIRDQTILAWRKRFGKLEAADVKRLRQLEHENPKLKQLIGNAWSNLVTERKPMKYSSFKVLFVCFVLIESPTLLKAQSSVPSARDIIQHLTPDVPDSEGNTVRLTRSLSSKLRPDPNTNLCELGASTRSGKSAETRSLYVEKAPAIDLDIVFDHNSSVLKPEGLNMLNTLAEALRDPSLANARFVVAGHTNKTGEEDYNRRLSCSRALAARDYLRDNRGIASARLIPMGFGFSRSKPGIDPTADENRRVEIRKAPG